MPIKIHHGHLVGSIHYHNTEIVREARSLITKLDKLIEEFTSGEPPKPPHHMAQFDTNLIMTHIGARDELIFFARRYGVTEATLAEQMTDPGPLKKFGPTAGHIA